MRKLNSLILLVGLVASCGDSPVPASGNGVTPRTGFIGRTMTVEISGDETNFADTTTLNFGDGVTVANIVAASPTLIIADLTIAQSAAPTKRDVVVTTGGESVTLKTAFEVQSPIELMINGTAAQGSLAPFTIVNRDFNTPFDDTSTGGGFGPPFMYTNLAVTTTGTGVRLAVTQRAGAVTPFKITGTAFFDTNAAAGTVTVTSGPPSAINTSALGVDLPVTARSATALTAGAAASGMQTSANGSVLYQLTPASAPFGIHFGGTTSNPMAKPMAAVLGPSGKWADLLAINPDAGLIAKATVSNLYAIYFDFSGTTGYAFNFVGGTTTLAAIADTEPANNNAVTATAATVATLLDNATLASGTDVDWFKMPVTSNDIGKRVHVVTAGPDPRTDTVVQVFSNDGTTSLGGESDDLGYAEDWTSTPITTAGFVYVKVSASIFFSSTHNAYIAGAFLQQ